MESPSCNNENIERKYLNKMRKNQFLKAKNSLLELGKDFIELKDRELEDRAIKIKREVEELFFKPIIVSKMKLITLNKKKRRKSSQLKILGMIG